MSSFARRQLEKFGWTDGDGLGKQRDGINTFVKAVRPKGERGDCFGIGHDATKGTRNSDMGFDAVLKELGDKKKKKSKKTAADSESDSSSDDGESGASSSGAEEEKAEPSRKKARKEAVASDSDSDSSADDKAAAAKRKQAAQARAKKQAADSSDSSDSDSSSDDDDGDEVLDWNDKKLFERCGGVRLGRGGRHRFFDGKLARIEANNASKEGADPYKIKEQEANKKPKKRNDFA